MLKATSIWDDTHYEFGRFQLLPSEQLLLQDGLRIPLTFKAFRTLHVLVANGGHLVDKEEIIAEVWAGSVIETRNLTVTIHMIRKALGDTLKYPKYIQTVSNRGYRFLGVARCTQVDPR